MTFGGEGRGGGSASLDELRRALAEIGRLAAVSGLRVAACGGYAMRAYGSDRLTFDLDVVSEAHIPHVPLKGAKRSLTFGGYGCRMAGVPVDVILRDDDYQGLYEEALDQAVRVGGHPVRLVRREHLVAMKMVAGRRKDAGDVLYLLSRPLDARVLRRVILRHLGRYAVDDVKRLQDEARWLRQRGELG